jgi:rRNA maturation protein Nop10
MRLKLILPVVAAEKYTLPEKCPYECGGKIFYLLAPGSEKGDLRHDAT